LKKKYSLSVLLILIVFALPAQLKPPKYFVETGATGGLGKQTPFWLVSNKNGLSTLNKNSIYLRTGFSSSLSNDKNFDYSYGLDLYNRYDTKNNFKLHQAYLKFKVYCFTLQGGKIEEKFGSQDSTLSSGNMLWSGNAGTMPQVSVSIPDYFPIIKGYIDVKGYISHVWVNDNIYIKDYYIHHKNAYIRIGSKFPVTFSYGLEHYVQWGGTSPIAGRLPSDFKAYYNLFFAKVGTDVAATRNDSLNRLGNHLGSKNFTLEVKTKPVYISLYWQYIFEDASYRHWENISDGLWGINIKFNKGKLIEKLTLELVRTYNQSGPVLLWNDTAHIGGNDDYFNNFDYKQGWSYYNRTIGTSLITSPIYNEPQSIGFKNNRIIAQNIGLQGVLPLDINYKMLFTYVQNLGTFYRRFPRKEENISTLIELSKNVKQSFEIKVAIGNDFNEMYGKNMGFLVSIKKEF
jgi:hypothetical protein